METELQLGQQVKVRSAIGVITRTVAGVYGDIVAVCADEDYRHAVELGIEPPAVGFRRGDISAIDAENSTDGAQ